MTVKNNFEDIEEGANLLTENRSYREVRIKKRISPVEEELINGAQFNAKEKFVLNVHNVICNVLISELSRRSDIYGEILKDFGLFFNFTMSDVQFNDCVEKLCIKYKNDIDVENFKDELIQFIAFIKEENVTDPVGMYKLIIGGLQSTFPNVETILKIFLTIPISNASGERSFSTLKRVKNYLRNSLSQCRLSHLSMMFIENDIVNSLDYENLIDKFAKAKARKVPI
uniref:Dimer_Tnp_hAT domain-containing protein n=1 Tax=Strongyloides stercoralis TaxID=6248 RepID=A0A0K0DZX3_STRER